MRWMMLILLMGWSLSASAIDLKRLQQVQKMQQRSLIAEARGAATDGRLDEAERLLEQAERQAYAPQEIDSARAYIGEQRAAKEERDRKQREEEERRQREAERRMAATSVSTGGRQPDFVSIQAECTAGFTGHCPASHLSVSGSPGYFEPTYSNASTGAVYNRGNGVAGSYQWNARFGSRVCGGSFSLSGSRSQYRIAVYNDCSDAGSGEW